MSNLPPHYLELVEDAVLKIYWHKPPFRAFLLRCGVPENLLATYAADETKRTFLNRLLPILERTDTGVAIINKMTDALLEQTTFVDLQRLDNSKEKIKEARFSQTALKVYVQARRDKAEEKRSKEISQKAARAVQEASRKRNHTLDSLNNRLIYFLN